METNLTEGLIAVSIIAIGLMLASFVIPQTNAMNVVPSNQNPDSTTNYVTAPDTIILKTSDKAIDSVLKEITLKMDANIDDNATSKEIEKVIEVALTEESE